MNWGSEDAAAAFALVIGAGIVSVLAWHLVRGYRARLVLVGGVILATLAIWADLAVGLF